jgi:hypothetical protein
MDGPGTGARLGALPADAGVVAWRELAGAGAVAWRVMADAGWQARASAWTWRPGDASGELAGWRRAAARWWR